MKVHPFADILPLASGEDFAKLKQDISKHGVKVPLVLFKNRILDGRSRYKAAREVGRHCPTTNFVGTAKDALELVTSLNLYRRHLTPSQKAAVAADISLELQRIEGMEPEVARQIAVESTGASQGYVEKAERIALKKPNLAKELKNGTTTINELYKREFRNRCPNCGHCW